jgi:hypothetical protein
MRPQAAARTRMPSRKALTWAKVDCAVNTASAMREAMARPLGDCPAWISSGRPWGEGTPWSGPRLRHLR